MASKTTNRFSPEVRTRAVRLVFDHEKDHPSRWARVTSIAAKIGCTAQSQPLLLDINGQIQPSLSMETLRVAQGASTYVVKSANTYGSSSGSSSQVEAIKVRRVGPSPFHSRLEGPRA
jgi:hypothetical protein